MTGKDAPVWPQGLTDDIPLPYSVWKVLDLVDGHLSAAEVGRLAGVSEEDVYQALSEAASRAQSHHRLTQRVGADLQRDITRVLSTLMGPIAGIIVEEVMEELGPAPYAGSVFQRISQELEPQQRAAFAHLAREQGMI